MSATVTTAKRKKQKTGKSVTESAKQEKQIKVKSKPERWQLTVAHNLLNAQKRRLKGEDDVKPSYGWFTFVRDLVKANDNEVPFKVFKKKALQHYESEQITEIEKSDFIKDLLRNILKHPKFHLDNEKKTISWVPSRGVGRKRDNIIEK